MPTTRSLFAADVEIVTPADRDIDGHAGHRSGARAADPCNRGTTRCRLIVEPRRWRSGMQSVGQYPRQRYLVGAVHDAVRAAHVTDACCCQSIERVADEERMRHEDRNRCDVLLIEPAGRLDQRLARARQIIHKHDGAAGDGNFRQFDANVSVPEPDFFGNAELQAGRRGDGAYPLCRFLVGANENRLILSPSTMRRSGPRRDAPARLWPDSPYDAGAGRP